MKTLIDASHRGTLINVSDSLSDLRDQCTSIGDIKPIERIRKAVDHVIENFDDSFRIGNPLINQDTADTLEAVQNVVLALHTSFNALRDSSLYDSQIKRSFIGATYILDLISEALEFEHNKLAGEAEGANHE